MISASGAAQHPDGGASLAEVRSTLEAWRARGADRVNPTRFRTIDALARRAAGYDGDVRRVLDERLAALIADYAVQIQRAETSGGNVGVDADVRRDEALALHRAPADGAPCASVAEGGGAPEQHEPSRGGPLAELAALLAARASAATASAASGAGDVPHPHRLDRSPDLPILDYFRETWSKFSAEHQLRQSREQVPDNAGPLNSNSLVHRSLSLMRELSPGYLQQFLSYVEALSWMERLAGPAAGAATAPAAEAPRASTGKKGGRRKAR